MQEILLWLGAGFSLFACIFAGAAFLTARRSAQESADFDPAPILYELERLQEQFLSEGRQTRQETHQNVARTVGTLGAQLSNGQRQLSEQLSRRQDSLQKTVSDGMRGIDARFCAFTAQNEQQLSGIRQTVETRLEAIQQDNEKKLEQMRQTVDEKLQRTLENRLNQSFQVVGERLEQVYKGLGEMQSLAAGVGDLKKVLSNVKTRGILGEVQLGAILSEILAPEQYRANVATKRDSRNVVEFAVVLPGDGETPVLLPIDAKFPSDAYLRLTEAYEKGDPVAVSEASAVLSSRIRLFAKDIRDKYIDPPGTTDFAVMFLPFEGLYAEALRLGLLEPLQRDFKVTIAGPTTMAAFLNSLQMGFQTLAIQKRSGEVWAVLGAVKTEFDRFGEVLAATQQRLEQANSELDKLVGVRTRAIRRRLEAVSALPQQTNMPPVPGEDFGED